MQLTSVRLQGFRNLNCSINLCGPLSLIVGENNSGKSNLIDAIRLVVNSAVESALRARQTSTD